ncbi:MAG: 2'-5' RNA ligase family protein [Patescibacteria group bacterium]
MRYYLSALLPEPLAQKLAVIKRRWLGEIASPPHLTLLPPRSLAPERSESELVGILSKDLSAVAAFPVVMTRLGSFRRMSNIHIRVERTPALVSCHQTIALAVQGILLPAEGDFGHLPSPHISLARGKDAWRALRGEDFADRFLCQTVHLWGKENTGERWRQIGVFHLHRNKDGQSPA